MEAADLSHIELILLLLLVLVAALALVAKQLKIAYPIVLVIGGLALSLIPEIPHVSLNPSLVIYAILPPLVFSAAFHTSWREFRSNMVSIVMLAFGLVGFTIIGVAATTRFILPGFNWKLGLVLGAVVAATDAIAATATAKRLGLPRRITELLEAESLVNDGSGLVALKFTLAMVVTGITPSVTAGVGNLFYLVFMAVVIGLAVGVVISWVQRRIADAPIEITISLITPYIVYLAAEAAQCSGVLAAIACGLYLGRRSSGLYSLHARIESLAVWRTLDFMLNGLVFLVLGLQLPSILAEIRGVSTGQVILDGALFSAVVVLLRLVWVYPGAQISLRINRYLLRREPEEISGRYVFLVGWAGMRGVLALAAALSLPIRLENGSLFPERNMIIFLTFCVIFTTLVLQGLSMPALIRRLGLSNAGPGLEEENWARRQMIMAALDALQTIRERNGPRQRRVYDELESFYQQRLALTEENSSNGGGSDTRRTLEIQRAAAQQLRDVERAVVLKLRDENRIHDEVLHVLEHELDLLDARFAASES